MSLKEDYTKPHKQYCPVCAMEVYVQLQNLKEVLHATLVLHKDITYIYECPICHKVLVERYEK